MHAVRQEVDAVDLMMEKSEAPTAALSLQLETLREELAASKYRKQEE